MMAPLQTLWRIGKRSTSQVCDNSVNFRGVGNESENRLAKLLFVFQIAAGPGEAKWEWHRAFEYRDR